MAESQAPAQQFSIQRIYLKDVSFETPIGVDAFKTQWAPKIQLDVNTKANKVADDIHEVVLSLTVSANQDDKTVLLIEIQQAGLFAHKGLEGDQLTQVLNTVCPNILFPYARELIDSLAVKGSFPALMLAPINFDALFQQAIQQQNAAKEGSTSH